MTNFRIEVGATDGFRYVGVEPCLDEEQRLDALEALGEDIALQGVMNGTCLATMPGRTPYSELALTNDQPVAGVMHKIAHVLMSQGHHVQVDVRPRYVGAGGEYRMFGDKSKATFWKL